LLQWPFVFVVQLTQAKQVKLASKSMFLVDFCFYLILWQGDYKYTFTSDRAPVSMCVCVCVCVYVGANKL